MVDTAENPQGNGAGGPLSILEAVNAELEKARVAAEEPEETPTETPEQLEEVEQEPVAEPIEEAAEEPEPAEAEALAEGEEPEEVEEAEDLYRVKVNGEILEVPLQELRDGYSRQQDYSRRMGEVSQQRQALDERDQQITQAANVYGQGLQQARLLVEHLVAEPDWEALKDNPAAIAQAHAQQKAKQETLQRIGMEQQRVAEELAQRQAAETEERMKKAGELVLQKIPAWSNQEVAQKEASELTSYLHTVGYTDQEIGQASDARAIEIGYKAMMYDRGQAQPKTVRRKGKPTMRSKPRDPGSAKKTAVQAAEAKFAKTGNIQDAVALNLLKRQQQE